MKNVKIYSIVAFFFLAFFVSGCAILKTLENVKRLKFRQNGITNIQLDGISLKGKNRIEDFSALEGLKFVQAFSNKKMPVKFVINIDVENPNNGKGGYPRTDLTLNSFPWRLIIDGNEIVTGNIEKPVFVPGVGETTAFPIAVEIDLYHFFGSNGYKEVIDLALRLAGSSGKPVDVKLVAHPVIGTPLGDLSYPGEITVVQKEFN